LILNIKQTNFYFIFLEQKKIQTNYFCLKQTKTQNKTFKTKKELKKYWYIYAKHLLTSSCIVYNLIGKNFKEKDKPMEYIFVYDFLSICGFINIVKNYFFEFNNLIENAANKVLEFGFTLEDFTNFNYSNLLDIEHLLEKSIENDKGFKLPSVSTLINRGPSEELFNDQSTSTSFSGSSNIIQPSTNLTTNELRKLHSKCRLIGGDFEKYKDETSLTKFVEIICGIDYKQLKFKMEEYNKILENKIILYKTLMEKIESNYLYQNLIT
ncbi:Eyes absent-like protein, partial [Meloidogyne graminicola]